MRGVLQVRFLVSAYERGEQSQVVDVRTVGAMRAVGAGRDGEGWKRGARGSGVFNREG